MMDHTIPLLVSDESLISNIIETPPLAWDGETAYAAGGMAAVFSGPNATVATNYESLQDDNLNHSPDTEPTWWKPVGTAYLPWDSGTNYAIGAVVTRNHRIVEATKAGSNHDPATSGIEWWRDLGPSNLWAMFDRQIETQTTHPDTIRVEIPLTGRFDTLALLGVVAASVNIKLMKGDVQVYDETFGMTSYLGIANYWDHFFNEISRKRLLYVTDLAIITGLTLIVTLTGTNVAVGHMVYGRRRRFGATQLGAELGFLDYSNYGVDDFGRRNVIIRGYKKQGNFDVIVPTEYVDSTYQAITDLRGTPALIKASERFEAMIYFGLITSAKITVQYKRFAVMRVQVEDF